MGSVEQEALNSADEYFENDEHRGMDQKMIREHEDATKVKVITKLDIGNYEQDVWYYSPMPLHLQQSTIYMCDSCLLFFNEHQQLCAHMTVCPGSVPGDEIYRDKDIGVFELDGHHNRVTCENLCLLSKMFLDHKTLKFDCSPFLFYLLFEFYDYRWHFCGYFSKEK